MSVIDPEPTQPESDGANAIDEESDRSVVSVDDEYSDVNEASLGNAERNVVLPEELCRSVVKLTCDSSVEGGECVVYLIGTAHVSLVCTLSSFIFYFLELYMN